MSPPIASLHKLNFVPRPAHRPPNPATAARFDASRAALGEALGLSKLGVNVTAVKPGKAAYPFHSHRANDELFLVLAGSGELRLGAQRHTVKEGDLIDCPAGDASSAHQLVNTGASELRYLAVSSQIDPEICEYPDSGKIGAYCGSDDKGLMHLSRRADAADYWDGE
ncbi:MAG: cupin domain-containing protein [Burkholderiaceae bacterium]|nr:cupin domain-containing protein [Burkholderiaceae bacterium]